MNPYLDINYIDRTDLVEELFEPTLDELKKDPKFYAELVNDLMMHWVFGTRETKTMNIAKQSFFNKQDNK